MKRETLFFFKQIEQQQQIYSVYGPGTYFASPSQSNASNECTTYVAMQQGTQQVVNEQEQMEFVEQQQSSSQSARPVSI